MEIVTDYGPDTPREIEAKRKLAELEAEYRQKAKPYIDILVDERNHKTPRQFVIHDSPSP